MISDLDRAYLINGDDLRIALAQRQWTLTKAATPLGGGDFVGRLKMPEEVVRAILGDVAKPLDEPRAAAPGITREQLAAALDGFYLHVLSDGMLYHGQVEDADAVASALYATLDRMAALRDGAEPEPCPFHLGNGALGECNCELKKYALATPAKPIVLHMGDEELSAIGCILAALEDLDADATERVLRYVAHRHGVETP